MVLIHFREVALYSSINAARLGGELQKWYQLCSPLEISLAACVFSFLASRYPSELCVVLLYMPQTLKVN